MTKAAPLQLDALGPPELRKSGEVVDLPPRLFAILAFIVFKPARNTIRRDTLLAAFWPESDGPHARNALNQVVHQLRRRLGSDVLESRGNSELALKGPIVSDVNQFESLLDDGDVESGLALYRGPLLEGFHVSDAPGFERWLDAARHRLRRRARDAALTAAASAEKEGRLDVAIGHLRRIVEIVPTDERAVRRLIRLLLAAGERDAALRAYRTLARHLEIELGVQPSDPTRDLVSKTGANVPLLEPFPRATRHRRVAAELTERAKELMRLGRGENLAARELLEQAIRVDRTYAPAYAEKALAIAYWVELFGGPWERLSAGRVAAKRALEESPDLERAHLALGMILEKSGHMVEAVRSYRSTIKLDPNNESAAARLGQALFLAGDFRNALNWIERCRRESEDHSAMYHGLALVHHALGEHDIGDDWSGRAIASCPENRYAHSASVYHAFITNRDDLAVARARAMVDREPDGFIGLCALGDALFMGEDFEGAIAAYEQCFAIDAGSRNWAHLRATRTALGYSHLRVGDPARGLHMLSAAEHDVRRLLAVQPSYGALHWEMAAVLTAQGHHREALSWLERACEKGWLQYAFEAIDPVFAGLRTEPRFQSVIAEMRNRVEDQRKG